MKPDQTFYHFRTQGAKKKHRQKNIEPTQYAYCLLFSKKHNCAVEELYNLYNYERHLMVNGIISQSKRYKPQIED